MEVVLTDELKQFFARNTVLNKAKLYHIHVTEVVEVVRGVVDVGHTTTHTSSKVAACLTEHNHASASHIFTAVVASTLDDGNGTRVAHAKALTYLTINI